MRRFTYSYKSQPPVGDDGFGDEEAAEGAEVGEVEDQRLLKTRFSAMFAGVASP